MGIGFVPLFLFASEFTPIWITPKFSVPIKKDRFNMGFGALIGTVTGESNSGFGILYSTATFGSRDENSTIGLGWGYGSDGLAETPTITFSYIVRVSKKGYFMTENYYIDGGGGENVIIFSLGGRSILRKVGLDYGFFTPIVKDADFIIVPWLGLIVPFGGDR